ncbi:MAG TPA: hypothetical protein VKQ11_00390 [Candidatus Sulfotelmatobacter sp.]|nr:hypothetical protein [Candidatus Sulfotelmatobacter sp.]
MDVTIARLAPAVKQLERIADSLELLAALYKAECDAVGLVAQPKKRINDPAEEDDVTYTDPEQEFLRELKKQYGILSPEEKALMKAGLSEDTVKVLETKDEE